MNQIQTIFKNMSWLLISQIIASICGFIWTILIVRYLGVDDYGILGFAISFTGILGILSDLGIGTHIIRHISTDYESSPKYLGNALPLKSIFSAVNFGLTLIILIIMGCNEITIIVTLLFTLESIFKSFYGLLSGIFQAYEKSKYQGIGNTVMNLLLLIFIFIVILTNSGLFGITFSYLISNFIALVYLYYVLKKHIVHPAFEFDKNFCKKITLAAIPFALSSLLYNLYYSVDIVMLTSLVGNYSTGIYNATYKLISILTLFYGIYTAVIFPVMSKLFKKDKKLLIISFEKSVKYLSLVIIPIAIGTMFYSAEIINLFYGNEYAPAAEPLSILIWTVCLLFINGATATILNASYKEMAITKINFIATIFNIILNFYMIPKYTYNGAAITTVLTDILILFMYMYTLKKLNQMPRKKLYYDLAKIISGSLILSVLLFSLNLNMWIALPICIIIYIIMMIILKVFDNEDKYIIKEILGKN